MATMTRLQVVDKVLSYLGVKAQGQNASADDLDLVGSAFDSVIDQLRPDGTVNFATSAVPEWAQWPLIKMISYEVGPMFGRQIPERMCVMGRMEFTHGSNTAQSLVPAKGKFY